MATNQKMKPCPFSRHTGAELTDESVAAWRRLNDAQAIARNMIGGQAMAPEGLPRKLPGQADD